MSRSRRFASVLCFATAMIVAAGCGPAELPKSTGLVPTTTTIPASTTTTVQRSSTTTAPTTTTPSGEPVPAPRVEWQGSDGFLLGANLPWYNFGCDFGCQLGARGAEGVSSPAVSEIISNAIEPAAAAGMNVVRWWLFPGEPWQITAGLDGLAFDIDEAVYPDIDAALELADQLDVSIVFTIFSAPSAIPPLWLTTEAGRQRLTDTLGDLFRRYGDEPRILTWQLVNEPEWDIWNGIVDLEDVQDLVAKVTDSIHDNTTALASIGSANLEGLDFWRDSGLDYYTAHWYDIMGDGLVCAVCTTWSETSEQFDLDAPIVIGEFYAGFDIDVADRLDQLHANGYAGAWAWSLLPDRTEDELPIDLPGVEDFVGRHEFDLAP